MNALQFDSRKVKVGDAFIAVKGELANGHQFISKAIELGAKAIVCEDLPANMVEGITYVAVKNSRSALSIMANAYFEHPSSKLKLVGVTGTNGKTTTVTMLHELFTKLGYKVGLLSTIENKIAKKVVDSTHTTPDPIALNALLNDMVESGCEFAFMEVSSHAIHQKQN